MHIIRRTISGGDRSMTGETIRGLLAPVIGKSGAVYLAVSNIGQVGLAVNENSKLTGVEVRPDDLVRLERETGWTPIDPNEVVAVASRNDTEQSEVHFLSAHF